MVTATVSTFAYYSVVVIAGVAVAGDTIVGNTSGSSAVVSSVIQPPNGSTNYGLSELVFVTAPAAYLSAELIQIRSLFSYAATALNPLQIEHLMHKQLCQSVRFRITVTPGSSAEALRLTSLGLSVGLLKGANRIASAKRF